METCGRPGISCRKWTFFRQPFSQGLSRIAEVGNRPARLHLIPFTLCTALLWCYADASTSAPSISVVTNGNQSVNTVKLWDRASLFCKNYLIEYGYDLSSLPPESGPCHVNWYDGNNNLLCETLNGRCHCNGSRRIAVYGGIVLVITRVTQAASGVYRCQYPSATPGAHHSSYMEFRVAVDAKTKHLSLYDSGSETIVLSSQRQSSSHLIQELICWYNGNPSPTVFWTKDGTEQDNLDPAELGDRAQNISFPNLAAETRAVVSMRLRSRKDMSKLEIRIRDFSEGTLQSARSLAGLYKCHITNEQDSKAKTFRVLWNLPEEGVSSEGASQAPQACAYVDVGGLCHETAGRFRHDPTSGNIIDCHNMTEQCSNGRTCLAVFKATEVDGMCKYVQTIGRCHSLQVEECSRACTASRTSQHNSTVQCCCHGHMCNYDVHLPTTCLLNREVHHCNRTPGYLWNATSSQCEDINECQRRFPLEHMYLQVCPDTMQCRNTIGSFECVCQEGYTTPSSSITSGVAMLRSNVPSVAPPCVDVNECALGQHDCQPTQTCSNTPGGYMCTDAPVGSDQCEVVSCAPCNMAETLRPAESEAYNINSTHCCWQHVFNCPRPVSGEKVGCFAEYDCHHRRLALGKCMQMQGHWRMSRTCDIDCNHYPSTYCSCEGNLCNHHEQLTVNGLHGT
eukprot:scpid17586/ scgid27706/ EGF-containing fibulin-like extracellular matrix protein 2; Fibulin-4; Mutant p53-binding protein 1